MLELALTFLKMGAFAFGSGQALAVMLQNEIVDRQKWMSAERFQDGWAAANLLPGPITIKVAGYVGYEQAGLLGAIIAVVAYVLPSVGGILVVAFFLTTYVESPVIKNLLRGIKPAVLALLVEAFLSFTDVAVPKIGAIAANPLAFGLVVTGVALSVAGMGWIGSSAGGTGKFLLADFRSVAIFGLALAALLILRVNAVLVLIGAAAIGLTYLFL